MSVYSEITARKKSLKHDSGLVWYAERRKLINLNRKCQFTRFSYIVLQSSAVDLHHIFTLINYHHHQQQRQKNNIGFVHKRRNTSPVNSTNKTIKTLENFNKVCQIIYGRTLTVFHYNLFHFAIFLCLSSSVFPHHAYHITSHKYISSSLRIF